jgi:hypothetical protein
MNMVSPNQMIAEAKKQMLDGNEPTCTTDWMKIVNFVAFNTGAGVEKEVCFILKTLYDIPLSRKEIAEIVEFQIDVKNRGSVLKPE